MLATLPRSPVEPSDPLAGAIARASEAACGVAGAFARAPCGFLPLEVAPPTLATGAPGTWVLVVCRRADEADHRAHLRERCLTAAQRFTLHLWSEGVEAVWTEADPAVLAPLAPPVSVPVGLVWCPAGGGPATGAAA